MTDAVSRTLATVRHVMRMRCTLFVTIGLLVVPLLLAGCTFWVQTDDGRVRPVQVADRHVETFVDRMDRLSSKLLDETESVGDHRLRRAAVELRMTYNKAVHGMGRGSPASPVDLKGIRLKLDAFERQLDRRLTSPAMRDRYRNVIWEFHELERAFERFRRVVL